MLRCSQVEQAFQSGLFLTCPAHVIQCAPHAPPIPVHTYIHTYMRALECCYDPNGSSMLATVSRMHYDAQTQRTIDAFVSQTSISLSVRVSVTIPLTTSLSMHPCHQCWLQGHMRGLVCTLVRRIRYCMYPREDLTYHMARMAASTWL